MTIETKRSMKTFYTVWLGQLISTIGSGLTGFALGVWVYTTTGSATLFAGSLLFLALPNLLFAPFAGSLADRFDRRLVMILADSLAGLSSLAVAILYWFGVLEVWHIYLAIAINATGNTLQWPAYTAATSLMVPKEKLGNASGMMQIGEAVSQLLAPAIAGVLFVTVGLGGVLAIDFLTFTVAILTLVLVRFPQPEVDAARQEQKDSYWQEFTAGFRYLRARTGLMALLTYFAIFNLFFGMISPLLVPMMLDMTTPDMMGYVVSFVGIGMLVGTVAMSAWGGPRRRIHGILGIGAVSGIGLMFIGYASSLWGIAAAGFAVMFLAPIMNGSSQALWQVKVEPELQGRVFAVRRMVAWSTGPLAIMLAGPLVDRVFNPLMAADGPLANTIVGQVMGTADGRGVGLLLVVMGICVVVTSLAAYGYSHLRNVETELPDVLPDSAGIAKSHLEDVDGLAVAEPVT